MLRKPLLPEVRPIGELRLEAIFSRVAPLMIFIVVIIVDQTIDDIWENRSVSFSVSQGRQQGAGKALLRR